MPYPIKIRLGSLDLDAQLTDSETARKILDVLPLESRFNKWGEEIYFSIPVMTGPEDGVETVEVGDIGYWPPGQAFCIFYGRTPASQGDEIRPASPVNIVGRVLGDVKVLTAASLDETIIIEKV